MDLPNELPVLDFRLFGEVDFPFSDFIGKLGFFALDLLGLLFLQLLHLLEQRLDFIVHSKFVRSPSLGPKLPTETLRGRSARRPPFGDRKTGEGRNVR